jgi:glutamate--cysteine ligase
MAHRTSGARKSVYRTGLGHRYGRRMQTISGIHYNFSLDDQAWPALA